MSVVVKGIGFSNPPPPTVTPAQQSAPAGLVALSNPSGIETFENQSINGCDSTITISLTFSAGITITRDDQLCEGESIVVNGTIYDMANTTGQEIIPGVDCDTTVNVDITFFNNTPADISGIYCSDYSILINGTTYDVNNPNGMETIIDGSQSGCDSVVNIDLDFFMLSTFDLDTTICQGESIVVNGTTYDESNPTGVESIIGGATSGCDSTINISLEIAQSYNDTDAISICEGDSVFLAGAWQFTAGDYTDMFITSASCDSIITTTLVVNPCSIDVVTSSTSIDCAGDSTGIIGIEILSTIELPFTIIWVELASGVSNTVTYSSLQDNYDILDLPAGDYEIIITDIDGSAYYQEIITISETSNPLSVVLNETTSILCAGDLAALNAEVTGGMETYSYVWSESTVGNESIASNLMAGTYELTVTDANGCTSTAIANIDGVNDITFDISATNPSCIDIENGIIEITNILGGTSPYSVVINGNIETENTIDSLAEGVYMIEVIDSNNCVTSTEEILVAGGDGLAIYEEFHSIVQGDSVTLAGNVNIPGTYTYTWMGDSTTLSCIDCPNPTANPSSSTSYSLLIMDAAGCEQLINVTVEVTIVESEDVFPNIFSPNDDGTNDTFVFSSYSSNVASISASIFDRWGNKVYDELSTSNEISWDGTKDGKRLDVGVYVYVITILDTENNSTLHTGDVLLMR